MSFAISGHLAGYLASVSPARTPSASRATS